MAAAGRPYPPLYIAACALCGIGIAGLGSIFGLHLPSQTFEGLLYIFFGCLAFGTGEILNHRKTAIIKAEEAQPPANPLFHRKRRSCGLGNLCDIAALLLFFIGLSDLLFGQ